MITKVLLTLTELVGLLLHKIYKYYWVFSSEKSVVEYWLSINKKL